MNWEEAIERHRKPLLRLVATLFALIGLKDGATIERLAWPLYRQVLRLLRPAEAAVRRLIILAARDIVVKPRPKRPASVKRASTGTRQGQGQGQGKGRGQGRRSFQLFDPRQRPDRGYRRRSPKVVRAEPRIHVFDYDARGQLYLRQFQSQAPAPKPKPQPRDSVNAAPLCRRLLAIKAALEDLASQAKRYARWRARPVEERRPKLDSPLRTGKPPGQRKTPTHAVHNILSECDWLASKVLQPDTS